MWKDEIYRKLLRAELGYPGAADALIKDLAERWKLADTSGKDALRSLLVALTPLAFDLLEEASSKSYPST